MAEKSLGWARQKTARRPGLSIIASAGADIVLYQALNAACSADGGADSDMAGITAQDSTMGFELEERLTHRATT
jgi:hypothetical protein